jgi:hypothetical protein
MGQLDKNVYRIVRVTSLICGFIVISRIEQFLQINNKNMFNVQSTTFNLLLMLLPSKYLDVCLSS